MNNKYQLYKCKEIKVLQLLQNLQQCLTQAAVVVRLGPNFFL